MDEAICKTHGYMGVKYYNGLKERVSTEIRWIGET
jgi:hypothetical protein